MARYHVYFEAAFRKLCDTGLSCSASRRYLDRAYGMNNSLDELAKNILLVLGALFPIVNPLGNTPIFLSLTRGLSAAGRGRLAQAIAMNGLVLMVASLFIGTHILRFFGLSLPVVQVGGGLIVISTGWAFTIRFFFFFFFSLRVVLAHCGLFLRCRPRC